MKKISFLNHKKIQDFSRFSSVIPEIQKKYPHLIFLLSDKRNINKLARRYAKQHNIKAIECGIDHDPLQDSDLILMMYPDGDNTVVECKRRGE